MKRKTKTTRYDVAELLRTPEETVYLELAVMRQKRIPPLLPRLLAILHAPRESIKDRHESRSFYVEAKGKKTKVKFER
jgi:hypothetical protein